MQLVADVAGALVPAQRVDARVAAAVLDGGALVELLHEGGRETGLLHRAVRLEDHEQLVGGRSGRWADVSLRPLYRYI